MNIAHKLAELISTPSKHYDMTEFISIGTGCFSTGDRSVICWEGENYVPQKSPLRVRLHNWLISR